MSIESVVPTNHLILSRPLLLPPSICPSIRVFSKESVLCIRWPKYWSFSFSISLSNEYSRLISFRMDWFDLLVVRGTLKSLLQHHSSKASILWHSAFFIVQLSHPYMTTGKTIVLTIQTSVGKVISLLFNMLSRLVITFLPRSCSDFNFMAAITICSDFGASPHTKKVEYISLRLNLQLLPVFLSIQILWNLPLKWLLNVSLFFLLLHCFSSSPQHLLSELYLFFTKLSELLFKMQI